MIEQPDGLTAVIATFGDPRPFVNNKQQWESRILETVGLQSPLIYAYDTTQRITRVRAHRLVVHHLVDTLEACIAAGVPRERMKYGGCYVWRAKRGGAALSLHCWGIAVDIEPAENPLGQPWQDDGVMLDSRVIEMFKTYGWFWGGDFGGRKDPQHWQWASGV